MTEPGLLDEVAKWSAGGATFGGVFLGGVALIKWFIAWATGRLDRKQDRIDAEDQAIDRKWQAYRETIERDRDALRAEISVLRQSLSGLHEEVERCHSEKRDIEKRLAKVEGFTTGRGEAAQLGQIGESFGRVIKDRGKD